ncbi:PH domain-containing protein [Candidatus Parcubacteria bacterium]|nr:PH domain-containing protein [Candidatus Parcubacteria bacterium]
MEKLHPKAIWLFFFKFIFVGLFLLFFFGIYLVPLIILPLIAGDSIFLISLVPLLFLAVYFALCYIWAKWTYNFWKYEATEDTFKMEHGVIYKRYVSIPYERIQNIDIHRGIMARLLGLSDLRIQTAGFGGMQGKWGSSAEGNLPGIEMKRAEELREELIKKIKGTKQGL